MAKNTSVIRDPRTSFFLPGRETTASPYLAFSVGYPGFDLTITRPSFNT
jgi:hypothetical protein